MTQQQVPDMQIANRAIGPVAGAIYSSTHQTTDGGLRAVAPPPQMPSPGTGARRQRVFGLVPAVAGGLHPLVRREKPRKVATREDISRTRAALRRADLEQRAAESAWVATVPPSGGPGDPDKLKTAQAALDRAAMLKRELAEIEASATSRPLRVELCEVRDPGELGEEIAKGDTHYVCLHDGCRGDRWDDEGALRRSHPTHIEMQRAQQCHVFALLCDSPLDPLDPEGPHVGYVAPIGRDGTTIARAVQHAEEPMVASAEEIGALRAEIVELRAMLAESMAARKPK